MGLFTQYVAVPFLNEDLKLHDTTIGMLGITGCIIQHVGIYLYIFMSRLAWLSITITYNWYFFCQKTPNFSKMRETFWQKNGQFLVKNKTNR